MTNVVTHPHAVRLSEVLGGLSYALDLTEGQREGHAVRSCLIRMPIRQLRIACPSRCPSVRSSAYERPASTFDSRMSGRCINTVVSAYTSVSRAGYCCVGRARKAW